MRILQVITRFIRGGAQLLVLNLAHKLIQRGHHCLVVCGPQTGPEGDLSAQARRLGIPLCYCPHLVREESPLNDLRALGELYLLMRRQRFEVVHTHTSKAGVLGRIAARAAGVKAIIHTPHGHIFAEQANIPGVSGRPLMRCLFYYLERFASLPCHRLVALTERDLKELLTLKIARKKNIVVIRNAISLARYQKAPRLKRSQLSGLQSVPEDVPLIGTVGRLTSEKGHRFLISALAYLKQRFGDVRLAIIGDGPERDRLSQQAKQAGVSEKVLFLGLRDDVPVLLKCLDVFVLPSLYEGFGLVILEAMAAQLPVVATTVGGVPDLVTDRQTGILVPPANPQALAEAIAQLLESPALAQRLARNAYKFAQENCELERMIDATENLYREVLAGGS
jgi:glycosyltransferase involved in cell wall biosynthesis